MKKISLVLAMLIIMLTAMSVNLFAVNMEAPTIGDGSEGNPYQIASLANLSWLAQYSGELDAHYVQTTDIDASQTQYWDDANGNGDDDNYNDANDTTGDGNNEGFPRIGKYGANCFTGSYDGQGYTIDALYIDRPGTNHIGLFGKVDGATIESVGVTNVDITGDDYVGGLVGESDTFTVSNSYSTGSVSGDLDVGGLMGSTNDCEVSNSYSTGSVSGHDYIGGLVGLNYFSSTVSNSYSTGAVSGDDDVGGLVGYNSFSTVSNSFWDTETSGQGSSAGDGTGKTTNEMQDVATFTDETTDGLDNAWDFETNPNDDSADNDYWDMDYSESINNGYPYLSWQDGDDVSLPVELSSFTANASVDGVTLKWRTETEVNNVGFAVYRSETKDDNYTKVVFVDGAGNSAMPIDYDFTDNSTEAGKTYYYYLEDVDIEGNKEKSKIITVIVPAKPVRYIPTETRLLPNYPNPFNPDTWIPFKLSNDANVVISIYDVEGQLIRKIGLGNTPAGMYLNKDKAVYWDGCNQSGERVSSGLYFYTLQAGSYSATKRMLILK